MDTQAVNILAQLGMQVRGHREADVRRREADARDPITYIPDRVRMTSRNMRNRFPRTRLNSVGDEPYSDGENN